MLLNLLTLHCYSLEVLILWTSLGVHFNGDRYFGFSKKVLVVALASQPGKGGFWLLGEVLAWGIVSVGGQSSPEWHICLFLNFPPSVGLYSLVYFGLCETLVHCRRYEICGACSLIILPFLLLITIIRS
jgi:hypothetical protein